MNRKYYVIALNEEGIMIHETTHDNAKKYTENGMPLVKELPTVREGYVIAGMSEHMDKEVLLVINQ